MTFSRVKPAGWTDKVDTITAAQINGLDVDHANALDMAGGGSYSLGADVAITGNKKWTWSSTGAFTFDHSVNVSSRSVTRTAHGAPMFLIANWTPGNPITGRMLSVSTTGATLEWPLDLPNGQVLTTVTAYIHPAGGHGGNIGSPPVLTVEYDDITAENLIDLGSTADPGLVPAYELFHTIVVGGLNHTIDRTTRKYYAKITAENGANAAANLILYGFTYTFTRTTIGED